MNHTYLIAIGSNIRHHRFGSPASAVAQAAREVGEFGKIIARSSTIASRPLGPSLRIYANGVMLVESDLLPLQMLAGLKAIEKSRFGRRNGRRWSSRHMDLDIILWNGGIHASPQLTVPHPGFRERAFVLGPASRIAPSWRDPISSLSLQQLNARLTKPRPIPR